MKKISSPLIPLFVSLLLLMPLGMNCLCAQTLSYEELVGRAERYLAHSESDKKSMLQGVLNDVKTAGAGDTYALSILQRALQEYVLSAEPTDGIGLDVTFLMTSPEMNGSAEGWSQTPTLNYGEAEFYNQAFDFYQTLSAMRPGLYRFNVEGFYRNSMYNWNIAREGNAGCMIYGNEMEAPLLTLYDEPTGAQFNNNTGGYANSMADAQQVFNQGLYADNAVLFEQNEAGEMTVGLRNRNTTNGNWACFRRFTLEYLGTRPADSLNLIRTVRLRSTNYQTSGAIVPGECVDANTPLTHTANLGAGGRSNYWYVCEVARKHYALRNVATGDYITYDAQRTDGDYVRRYLDMTPEVRGDSSLWTVTWDANGAAVLRNVKYPNHLFDVRVNSWVVGTYDRPGAPADNQTLFLYDTKGEQVTELKNSNFQKGVVSILFNGTPLIYDRLGQSYFFPVPDEILQSGTFAAQVDYQLSEGFSNLEVDGQKPESGGVCLFEGLGDGPALTLRLTQQGGDVHESTLYLTSLPVVEINGTFGTEYTYGDIRVSDPMGVFGADTTLTARIKWRGATTRYRNKKQYAVKLYDDNGAPTDVSFFGLRADNNWILDGMVIDKARMRNRVVTDWWNDHGAKPYYIDKEPEALTGTRGRFVELLLNGQYAGLYCMTEKIDRKQMKLKKYDDLKAGTPEAIRGQLYKASDWSYAVFMGHNSDNNYYPGTSPVGYNNNSEVWDSYEVKYPDLGDGQPVDWAELYNAVNFVCTATDEEFIAQVGTYFDLPPLVDYYVLMEVILSADNHGKNMYWGIRNRHKNLMLTLALWDLDSTCGRRWDASEVRAEQDYTEYITYMEHGDFNLFRRLKACNVDNFDEAIRMRYKALRAGSLHTDSLMNRFLTYKEQFDRAGASTREEERWSNMDIGVIDFDDEMDYLNSWFTTRLNYLDEAWDIASLPDPVPDGIEDVESGRGTLRAWAEAGTLVAEATAPCQLHVLDLSGRTVMLRTLPVGKTRVGRLPQGVYLVNGQKIVIR